MKIDPEQKLVLCLAILSALGSLGATGYQINRRQRLTRELTQTRREFTRLIKQFPESPESAMIKYQGAYPHQD